MSPRSVLLQCVVAGALLATHVRGQADEPVVDVPSAERLVRDLASEEARTRRMAAIHAARRLALGPNAALVTTLREHARTDPEEFIRGRCLVALAAVRDPDLEPFLVEALDETSMVLRTSAIEAVGLAGARSVAPRLHSWLDDPQLRAYAARALARIQDEASFDAFATRLRAHRDDTAVIDALASRMFELDNVRAIDLAVELAVDPKTIANHHLGRDLAAVPEPLHARVRELVTPMLDLEFGGARRTAIRALAGVGDLRSVARLLRALANEPTYEFRRELVQALGSLGHEFAAEPLGRIAVEAADEPLRRAAVTALARIGHVLCVEPLDAALRAHPDDAELVVQALWGLGRTGDRAALPILARYLQDPRTHCQEATVSFAHSFPWNVRLADVAAWAARTVLDGEPPCPESALSSFPIVEEVFDAATREALAARIRS